MEEIAIQDTQTLKITHEEIGNHLGNPREVVTRMLKYFSREGMVELARGTIRLTDVKNSGIYKRRPPSGFYPERRYFIAFSARRLFRRRGPFGAVRTRDKAPARIKLF